MKVPNKLALFGLLLAMIPPVLAEDPDSASLDKAALADRRERVHTYLMNIYISQKRKPEALSEFRTLVSMKPNDPNLNLDLGKFEASSGQLASAISHIKKACELEPNNAENWAMLGAVYLKSKDYQKALDAYDHAVDSSRQINGLSSERYKEIRNQTFEYVQQLKRKILIHKRVVLPAKKYTNTNANDDDW